MSRVTDVHPALGVALADRYRIEREIGRGGMATVYVAEDVRHRRKVALKVLHPELSAVLGSERFLKEIELTASLQHPHILPLFDSGEVDGQLFYVMPFVDGQTLRARLERETQLPIGEAIQIARETADALQYAHERGVVHRDIKPENILLQGGHALVADFGIALAVQQAGGERMTQTGLSLGTPQYMAPEQAMGDKNVDARADVYALGAVVYEMLTGEPPFTGASAQAIVARVLTATPAPIAQTRATVSPQVEHAVATALAKLPADRFTSARAFADALTNPTVGTPTIARSTSGASWKERSAAWLAVAVAVLLVTTVWAWTHRASSTTVAVTRLDVLLPPATRRSDVVVSPDGSTLAFQAETNGEDGIFVRRLDGEPDFRKVPGSEGAVGGPAFSPDSRWLVFRRRDSSFVKISVNGGGAITIARSPLLTNYPHWGTEDVIVGSTSAGVWRYSSTGGGQPEMIIANTGRYARVLPDGSGILFARNGSVFVYDFKTKTATELVKHALDPEYVRTGHLLYISERGSLVAVPFDLRRHAVTGPPVSLVEHVGGERAQRGFSVSETGVLVYREGLRRRGTSSAPIRLATVTLDGRVEPLLIPGNQATPRVSHDGRFIAYASHLHDESEESDIFTVDLATKNPTQITFSGASYAPMWSPDDKRILFTKGRLEDGDLYEQSRDSSGTERRVLAMPNLQKATAWMNDGTIVFESSDNLQADVYTFNPKTGGQPTPYLNAAWSESGLHLTTDGTLAAFRSLEDGSPTIWIRDFPTARAKWRVGSGTSPKWSPDGKYVYYWHLLSGVDSLYRVRVDRTPATVVHQPEAVLQFETNESGAAADIGWDFFPDGTRIVIPQPVRPSFSRADSASAQQPPARYIVVLNWFSELEARVSAKRP